jgi:hypothetical protein
MLCLASQESTATARLGEAKTENCKSRSSSATLILRPLFCVCLLSLFSIGRRCLCLVLGPTSLQKLAFSPGMGNGNGNASPPCDAWRLVIGPLEHPGSCWEGGVAIARLGQSGERYAGPLFPSCCWTSLWLGLSPPATASASSSETCHRGRRITTNAARTL